MALLKLSELCQRLRIEDEFLRLLEKEALVEVRRSETGEAVVSDADAERLRVISVLREMEVNVPGMEIILRMREDLVAAQHQFDEILQALVEELRKRIEGS